MIFIRDYQGIDIRLTDERLFHILEHIEMRGMTEKIGETLQFPESVIESLADPKAILYYRYYYGTKIGDKWLCVVVKYSQADAFILTAYLTDKPKKGKPLWPNP